ncbi:hypothetical protein ACHAXR_010127, partial [Thalassiosira sp. AJA248-18]
MKAPPPRSWQLALGTPNAPSPQVLAAMAMLSCAGLAAAESSSSDADTQKSPSFSSSNSTSATITNAVPPPRVVPKTITSAPPRIQSIGPMAIATANRSSVLSTSTTQMPFATPSIIATSDASAERSASLAAAARLSGKKTSSPFSVETQDIVKDSSVDAANAATELEQSMNINNERSNEIDNTTVDEANSSNNNKKSVDDGDSYPTFTPYHNSLLKKYLTPTVWSKLSNLQTTHGTTIEDIISAGLALPIGSNPPRRVGVLVGDAECYSVFRELLDPIISEIHGIDNYEEWSDPELPMESYFTKKKGVDNNSAKISASGIPPSINDIDNYGVIKSSGGDDDSDENDDSSFFLDEEDDAFVEYVALPSSPPSGTTTTSTPSKHDSQSSSSTTARNVTTIASNRKGTLRRHPTIINNPRLVTSREADPGGKYIVSTRIRVARSLDGIKFPTTMSRSERRHVQHLIQDCTQHFEGPSLANGMYLPLLSMTNDQNLDLIERHVLFDNPNEWTIASGLGRDWPDGRALYANVDNLQNQTPDFMIWVNEEDHLRIMCLRNGGDIQGVFTTLMNGVRELERELSKRGWHFAYDPRLGYLTSCPTNVGTTMRASVHVRLTKLGRLPGFFKLVERLKLEVRGKYGETDRNYTCVFDISNAERLGKSEVHLINVMVEGVAKLIELERRLEAGEMVNIDEIA